MRDKDTIDSTRLRGGMQVFGAAGQPLGAIERFDDAELVVQGQRYPLAAIDRIEGDRVYLAARAGQAGGAARRGAGAVTGAGATTGATRPAAAGTTAPAAAEAAEQVAEREGQVRVPVREERLEVEKRPAELGAVEVRTTVETEQQTVPVELEREEVRVRQEVVPARPATDAADDAFEEGTVRVPVRGEEAVARKETVVTGEVVIDKARTTQTQEVAETVRRERVEVDQAAARRPGRPRPGPRRAPGPSASVVSGCGTWPRGRRWSAPTGPPWAGSRRCGTATSWSTGGGSGTCTSRSRLWRRPPPGGCASPCRPPRWTTRAGPTRRSCNAPGRGAGRRTASGRSPRPPGQPPLPGERGRRTVPTGPACALARDRTRPVRRPRRLNSASRAPLVAAWAGAALLRTADGRHGLCFDDGSGRRVLRAPERGRSGAGEEWPCWCATR